MVELPIKLGANFKPRSPSVSQEQLIRLQNVWGLGIRTADGLERKLVCFSLKHSGLRQCGGKLPVSHWTRSGFFADYTVQRELSGFFLEEGSEVGCLSFPSLTMLGLSGILLASCVRDWPWLGTFSDYFSPVQGVKPRVVCATQATFSV